MRQLIRYFISSGMLCSMPLVSTTQAQSGPPTNYKANCAVCHGPDGTSNTPTGRALHAKDLRSEEVQTKSDADLADAITKGNGGMPAFGAKLSPEDIHKTVAYIRDLAKKKQ